MESLATVLSVDKQSRRSYQKQSNLMLTLLVTFFIQVFGIVACHETFNDQHKVVNGASDLIVQVFGPEIGAHARSAIGTNALPLNISVEVEAIVELKS